MSIHPAPRSRARRSGIPRPAHGIVLNCTMPSTLLGACVGVRPGGACCVCWARWSPSGRGHSGLDGLRTGRRCGRCCVRSLAAFLVAGRRSGGRRRRRPSRRRSPAAELVPDPDYTPREGDRVTLIADATPGFSLASLFDDYFKSSEADNPAGIRAMIDKGQLVDLEGNVPVLVIRNLDPADSREPDRHYPVEVRILGGTRAGETWFVAESSLARMVPKVVHPPLEKGSYATIAAPRTIVVREWDAFDPAAAVGRTRAATEEAFRLDAGVKVVVLERRGEAVRVRVHHPGSKLSGRVGVVDRAGLRPIVPPSRPVEPRPPDRTAEPSRARRTSTAVVPRRDNARPAISHGSVFVPRPTDCDPFRWRIALTVGRRPPRRLDARRGVPRPRPTRSRTVRRGGPADPRGVLLRLPRQRDQEGRGRPRRPRGRPGAAARPRPLVGRPEERPGRHHAPGRQAAAVGRGAAAPGGLDQVRGVRDRPEGPRPRPRHRPPAQPGRVPQHDPRPDRRGLRHHLRVPAGRHGARVRQHRRRPDALPVAAGEVPRGGQRDRRRRPCRRSRKSSPSGSSRAGASAATAAAKDGAGPAVAVLLRAGDGLGHRRRSSTTAGTG